LGRDGLGAAMTVDGGTASDVVLTLLHAVRLPHLHPGQSVMRDQFKAHQVAGVTAAGAESAVALLDLPASSPAFSPMAEWWSKVQALVRTQAARPREALEQAMAEAGEARTANEAQGWFTHAGYCVVSN
jgi:D-alanyl-D-alanine dipeptidase